MDWQTIIEDLENGKIRAANKIDGAWQANVDVKKGSLRLLRRGNSCN